MNTTHPISALTPTLDAVVIEALERSTEPMTLVSIQELAGAGSLSGLRRAARRLVEFGVVTASGAPPRYALNREHLVYPAIQVLVSFRTRFYERVRHMVATWQHPVSLVGVFGSFARGEGDLDSDIDLLIVGGPSDDEVTGLADAVERWTGNPAQIVVLSEDEYQAIRASGESVAAEWDRDLVAVAGAAVTV